MYRNAHKSHEPGAFLSIYPAKLKKVLSRKTRFKITTISTGVAPVLLIKERANIRNRITPHFYPTGYYVCK